MKERRGGGEGEKRRRIMMWRRGRGEGGERRCRRRDERESGREKWERGGGRGKEKEDEVHL